MDEHGSHVGPIVAMFAPQQAPYQEPNYAVGWHHFTPENENWYLLDGVFWVAVKGEIDMQDIMPGCEPFAMDIPTGHGGEDELWTVLSAPPGMFWHETMQLPNRFNMLKERVTGREICLKNVAINANGDIMDELLASGEEFSELPPMFPPGVVADDRVMGWNDCAAAAWEDPVDLGLSLEGLDDGRTRTIMINNIVRVALTPTLVKVLIYSEAEAIHVGLITPRIDRLEFVARIA